MHGLNKVGSLLEGYVIGCLHSLLDIIIAGLTQIEESEVGSAEPSCGAAARTSTFGTDGQLTVNHQHLVVGSHADGLPLAGIHTFHREGLRRNLLACGGLCIDMLVVEAARLCNQVGSHSIVTIRQVGDGLSH